jgi:cytochrome c-type biogenesis protein CcmF
MTAHVTSDFSVENVWRNSAAAKPLLYKISGVWGNHEGSMVLWVLILALFGAAVAIFGTNLPYQLKANVLAVQASIAAAFLLFIVTTSNPFVRPRPGAVRRPGLESGVAGPGARLPSALPLHGLCRLLDGILLRHRCADRRPH